MRRRLILGVPASRETRKQFPNYREHIIPLVLAAADDGLNEHLQYCLRYIAYQRHVVTSGRISYLFLRYNGYGRAEVDLVVEDPVTTLGVAIDSSEHGQVAATLSSVKVAGREMLLSNSRFYGRQPLKGFHYLRV